MPKKRANKTKKEIVSGIQLVTDANRRRALIKDVIFPYLVEVGEDIGYSKVFLQSLSGLINGEFDETRKTTTVGHLDAMLEKKLRSIFSMSDPAQKREYLRYKAIIGKMRDISVQDFTYASELPRYIDGYIAKSREKDGIGTVSIDKILG